jgi:hypothetical protein
MKNYIIQDSISGNFIEDFETLEEADKALKNYETEDKKDGIFVKYFYEIKEILKLQP